MNNFPEVNHFHTRNLAGVSFMLNRLAVIDPIVEKETVMGHVAMGVLKTVARKVFGSLPLFRTRIADCGVETFQSWYNDFAEINNMKTLRNTGVWDEATESAFNSIVEKA